MIQDTVVTNVDQTAWDAYVDAHPGATGYHRWLWRNVFESAFEHETVYFAAVGPGGITGVLPLVVFESRLFGRFGVSLPFLNYGGVLSSTEVAAYALVDAASRFAAERRLRFLELRHRSRMLPDLPAKHHKVAMRLALAEDESAAWDGLDRKVRNQVRKAVKSGLTHEHGGQELLGEFYSVFSRNMRDLGTPVYGLRFFESVLSQLGPAARVFVVRHGAHSVAGAITCQYRDVIEVPWASSLRSYRTFAPSNLLYWSIICYAIAQRMKTLDFGRSTPDEGTFHFKKQWGAEPAPLVWEYWLADRKRLPNLSPKNYRFQPAIAVWKRLPVPMTTWIGPSIVRNIP